MKRNLLILSCTIILCFSLTSCGLKNAITGNKSDSSNDNPKVTTSTPETESDITNNESNEESVDTNSDAESIDDLVSNSNDFLKTEDSTSTNVAVDTSSTSAKSKTSNRDCRVFYFNKVDLKTYCTDTSVTVIDNALVTALTEKLYEAPDNNTNFLVLSKDYGVKSATLDYETNILKVVFNEDFIDTMNLDLETANGLIQSIVNTYGYNYGVEKVSIYLEDILYTGLEETDSLGYSKVNYSSALKLN